MGAYSTLTSLLGYQHEAEQDRDQPIRNARQAPVQHVVPVAVDPIAQRLLDVDHLDHVASANRLGVHSGETVNAVSKTLAPLLRASASMLGVRPCCAP